jgi:hypothetical protein
MKSTMRTPPQLHKPKRNRIKDKRKNKGKKAASTILPWRRRRALSRLQLLQMGTKQNNSRHTSQHPPQKKAFSISKLDNVETYKGVKSMQTWTGDGKEECKDVVVLVVVFLAPPSVRAGAGGGGLWRERERARRWGREMGFLKSSF